MSNKILSFLLAAFLALASNIDASVRLKELGRFEGVRDNQLVGYGLVVGLASTGDSSRSKSTVQSIANTLIDFGVNIKASDIRARNVAAVMVTAVLPPFSEKGDKIDVSVSSMGDSRSLAGGLLVMTPLKAVNGSVYALAQGPLSVGGFSFDSFDSVNQKNHPTVGLITNGALIEKSTNDVFFNKDGELDFIINKPDFTTLSRITKKIKNEMEYVTVIPVHAGKLKIKIPNKNITDFFNAIAKIEKLEIIPDQIAKIILNERTGTLVAGGNVKISSVTISHGSLRLVVDTRYNVSQPFFVGQSGSGVRTQIIPDTSIDIDESNAQAVELDNGATVADLVESLRDLNVTTRDIIVIIQAIKKAGALQAELIIE